MFEGIQSTGSKWQLFGAPTFYEGEFVFPKREDWQVGWRHTRYYYNITMYTRADKLVCVNSPSIDYTFRIMTGKEATLKKIIDVKFIKFTESQFLRAAHYAKGQNERSNEPKWMSRQSKEKILDIYIQPSPAISTIFDTL